MRRILMTAAVAAAFALPIAAQAAGKTVTIGMRLEPPALDPTTGAAAAISQVTTYNIFETLTKLDNTGKVHPMLAESWTISDDGLSYTFKLAKGVKFHDGSDFDAQDVLFTFERNKGPDSKNKRKATFEKMVSISAPDSHTVQITLDAPYSLLTFDLAQAVSAIVAPETAATNETNPVGTGPYKFDKWVKGDSVTMVKFADHRNAANVQIERATFRFINDSAAQVAALLAGDLDYMPALSASEMFGQFETHPDFNTLQGTTEGETIIAMNNGSEALSDVRVRRAIMHAVDRNALIEGASGGYGTPIGTHFAPHHPAYVDLTDMSAYDPEKAKALLAEAGYGDGLELSLKLPPPSYARRGGEIVADMLGKVGITTKIENVEWPVWLDQVYKNKQYDLTIISHVEPMDLGIYARENYYFNYDSPEFRAILAKADSATTVAEQTKYLQAAQRKLAEDAVNGFMYELSKLGVAKKGLTGLWNNWPAFINEVAAMKWES